MKTVNGLKLVFFLILAAALIAAFTIMPSCMANREYNWHVTRKCLLTQEGNKCGHMYKIEFDTASLTIEEMRIDNALHTFALWVEPLDTIWLYKPYYLVYKDSTFFESTQHGVPAYCPTH